jgi:CHAD domain-containing protein
MKNSMTTPVAPFSESISAYHTERWRDMNKYLKLAIKKGDEESVHRARVEIKKISALYEFAESCDKKYDSHRELKHLTRIFKLLGRMRDYNRALVLCRKFKVDTGTFGKEEKDINKIPEKIKAKADKYKSDFRKIKKENTKRLRHANTTLWKAYLRKKYEEIGAVIAAHPPIEDLHHARRSVKYLLYDTHLSSDDAEDIIKPDAAAQLDKLQNSIGDWHDMMVFTDKLRKMRYDGAHPAAYASVVKSEAKLRKQITSMS